MLLSSRRKASYLSNPNGKGGSNHRGDDDRSEAGAAERRYTAGVVVPLCSRFIDAAHGDATGLRIRLLSSSRPVRTDTDGESQAGFLHDEASLHSIDGE